MRIAMIGLLAATTALLAGCEFKAGKNDNGQDAASISIGTGGDNASDGDKSGLTIDTPGFKAAIDIDGVDLGGEHVDIDGMDLYPGTKVARVAVGDREGVGGVDMRFTSPGTPDQIAAHYAAQAKAADYSEIRTSRAGDRALFSGTTPQGGVVTIDIAPAKTGSSGTIMIRETKA